MVERMGSTSEAERQSALTAFNAVLDRLNGLSYPSRTSLTLRREIIETVQQQLSALQQNMTVLALTRRRTISTIAPTCMA